MMQEILIAVPSNKFDGHGWQDPVKVEAASIFCRAFRDEFEARGQVACSGTLREFLEFRIAEALRRRDN